MSSYKAEDAGDDDRQAKQVSCAESGRGRLRRTQAETAEIELPLATMVCRRPSAQSPELMTPSRRRPLFHGRSIGGLPTLPSDPNCRPVLH